MAATSLDTMPPDVLAWERYRAVLFDLDGVVTPTADVHLRAWTEMFNAFLVHRDARQPAFTVTDYHQFVDGKPRYDGVRSFLLSRGITLPEGSPDDAPTAETVCGLGNRKNEVFNEVLERDGVQAYPGSVAFIDYLERLGVPMAIVSSSANAVKVLDAAGMRGRFATIVDGVVARAQHLAGKPHPDTFLYGAQQLGATAEDSVVLEDAVSGVQAGAAGAFAQVIGVDRGAGAANLAAAGATIVVSDLAELVPAAREGENA